MRDCGSDVADRNGPPRIAAILAGVGVVPGAGSGRVGVVSAIAGSAVAVLCGGPNGIVSVGCKPGAPAMCCGA